MVNNFILQQFDMKTHASELEAQIDMRTVTNAIMTSFESSSDKSTSELSMKSIITAIEKYNTDNHLVDNTRIKYSVILAGGVSINVCYAYFSTNHTKTVTLVGYDNANYQTTYDSNGKVKTLVQAMSTHIVALDKIVDVQFGKYDSSLENTISGSTVNNRTGNIYIEGLERKLNAVYGELFSMLGAGRLRDFIIRFNIEFVNNKYNEADYTGNAAAHDLYIKLWALYISTVAQIIVDFDSTVNSGDKKYKYVAASSDLPNDTTQDYQNTFCNADITLFRSIVVKIDPIES